MIPTVYKSYKIQMPYTNFRNIFNYPPWIIKSIDENYNNEQISQIFKEIYPNVECNDIIVIYTSCGDLPTMLIYPFNKELKDQYQKIEILDRLIELKCFW
jgi:hypothetical protein